MPGFPQPLSGQSYTLPPIPRCSSRPSAPFRSAAIHLPPPTALLQGRRDGSRRLHDLAKESEIEAQSFRYAAGAKIDADALTGREFPDHLANHFHFADKAVAVADDVDGRVL